MERLNDNEVKEVARMQRLITMYENTILAFYMLIENGAELNIPLTKESNYVNKIRFIGKYLQQKKNEEKNFYS